MKLTHPCKDTCSGYSQDCAEQIEQLQARVKELEFINNELLDNQFPLTCACAKMKIENARLQKLVDAAKSYFLTRDLEASEILGQEFLK